jgi:phage/plasmid primase-like uncharacterized protein
MMHAPARDLAQRWNLRRTGRREWRGNCPACGYVAAFVLTERDGRPLLWCASCRDRGDMTKLLRGIAPTPMARSPAPTRRDVAERTARALALWNGAVPAEDTPADIYLTEVRGLPGLAASPALRFQPDTPHPSGCRLPALLALVVNAAGEPVALHRTFLRRDGRGKADVMPQKASVGPVAGAAIRLDPAAPEIVVAEGIETAASAGRLLGLPAWSAISAGNLERSLALPAEVRSVVIAADPGEPGERAARRAAWRCQLQGKRLRIALPNHPGSDFNDLLKEAPRA